MILGSHNTMSYLRPQWWLRPFGFMAKCQSEHIMFQFQEGARMFDLRVVFKNGIPHFAHGLATYGGESIDTILDRLNCWSRAEHELTGKRLVVRVILERGKDYVTFTDFCNRIDRTYTEIQFCGFRSKDWKFCGYWYIRDGSGVGIGDTGSVDLKGKDWSYSSRPCSGFHIEFKDKYSSDNCDKHSHCTGFWFDDLWPRWFARKFNKKWREEFADYDGFLMQDFVGKY